MTIKKIAIKALLTVLANLLIFSGVSVSLAQAGKTEKPQVKLPALLLPPPKTEWKKYEENVKRGNKTMKAGITFSFTNWDKYGEVLFKLLEVSPVCSSAGEDTRMIVEVYNAETKQSVYTNCAPDPEQMKNMTVYILPENQIPKCVYAVLTDRQTGRKVEGNYMDVKGAKVCILSKNDQTEGPKVSVTLIDPKKP